LAGQTDMVGPRKEAFYEQLLGMIEAMPGVRSASAINHLPLAGDVWGRRIAVEGRPVPALAQRVGAVYRVCRPKYFSTMGIAIARGRDFAERDRLNVPDVVIINETLARRQFGNEDPLGKRLTFDDPRGAPNWLTIVGVVKDAKQGSWAEAVEDEIYLPWSQTSPYLEATEAHSAYMTLVIRTTTNPRGFVSAVESAVWSLNKNAPVSSVVTMEEVVANAVWQQKFNLALMGIFALLALVLAAVGIYGVMAYVVAQRTHEIGIRLALGAGRGDLLRMVVVQGMRLASTGLALGLLCALALTRALSSLLYEVGTADLFTFVGVASVLLVVSFLACYLPARRAAKVDAMVALRYE